MTRKNAGGSHNPDTARTAASAWTVTATAHMAGLNIITYLAAYLDECGLNGGKPLSGRHSAGSCPGTPAPRTSAPGPSHRRTAKPLPINTVTVVAPSDRHAGHPHAFQGLPSTYCMSAQK